MPVKCRGCGEPLPISEDDPYNELKHENNCLALKLGECQKEALNMQEHLERKQQVIQTAQWKAENERDAALLRLGAAEKERDELGKMLHRIRNELDRSMTLVSADALRAIIKGSVVERHAHFWNINSEGTATCACGAVSVADEDGDVDAERQVIK